MIPTFDILGDPLGLINTKACAEASRLAYAEAPETGEFVFMLDCGNAIVIACPGTRNIHDVWRDVQFRRVPETLLGKSCEVHDGFNRCFNEIIPTVDANLANETRKPIFITGHSKGAAVARRIALDIREHSIGWGVHAVIIFGEPRGGDARYSKLYNDALGDRTLSIANGADPVCWMPGWFAGFRPMIPNGYLPAEPANGICIPRLVRGASLYYELAFNIPQIISAWRNFEIAVVTQHHLDNYIRRINALN